MKSFTRHYFDMIVQPRRAFEALLSDPRRLRFGALALAITAVAYTLVYVFLFIGGAQPTAFEPWLAIPAEDYYRYNRFLLAPSLFLAWLVAASVIQLLGHLARGQGSFEDTLAALGFAIAIPTWASLVHDLTVSFLGATRFIDAMQHEAAMNAPTPWRTALWFFYGAYLIWFLIVFPKAVGAVQRVSALPATVLGVLGFAAYQLVFVLFNR